MTRIDTETCIMPHTHGRQTFDAVHVAFYTVSRRSYGIWSVASSLKTLGIARAEASRRVELFGHSREDVRIDRRWKPVRTA